jgi:glutathione S-transferase
VHKQLGALFNPKMTPEMREVQLGTIERRFNALERMLGGRSHVMGERFSVGDAYLFTVLNWTGVHKIDVAKWPNIKAYLERVRNRPKVQEALKAEGLLK